MKKKKILKFFKKQIPLWMVAVLLFNTIFATGAIQYYVSKKIFVSNISELSKTTQSTEEFVQILKQKVLPQSGYRLAVEWNDLGVELLNTGAIDEEKYRELFINEEISLKHMWHLKNKSNDNMVISEGAARFMVNTLWALGLVNKSKILDEGSMQKYSNGNIMNFASTGGWNLGAKDTQALYSSSEIIKLTPDQEALVEEIAQNIYRPCCGNHTEFPDCNHGMAALGYIQAAVKQGVNRERIYKDLLALNSFWFPQNYVELAAYLNKQGDDWEKADPKRLLSKEFSSSGGSSYIKQQIQDIPGFNVQGGGCSA